MAKPVHIVRLDGIHCAPPVFTIPHIYTEYPTTTPDQVAERIQSADVIISTNVSLTAAHLSPSVCPNLKLLAVQAIGTDKFDVAYCKERGVLVCNVPAASNEAVAEHALAMYMALKRRIVALHELMVPGTAWAEHGSIQRVFGGLPGSWKEEVVGIIGAGELGNRVADICRSLGMTVHLAERKGLEGSAVREGRTSFTEILTKSTVIILTCPLTPETLAMIDDAELRQMRPDAIIVNVARGGIVIEEALVTALKEGRLAGAATDVFVIEPATRENSALMREAESTPNLILTPHLAWYGKSSIDKLRRTTSANIDGWFAGNPQNLV